MALPPLPLDIILDILSRFPNKFIGKTRLLSKHCTQSIHHSYFKNLHAQRSGTTSGFLLQSLTHNKPVFSFVSADTDHHIDFSLNFLPGWDPHILAVASHGLILCETKNPLRHRVPKYYICKPLTKQWQQLPNPKTRYFTVHTAMMVHGLDPLRFKVLRLSKPKPSKERLPKSTRFICEIFDSQTWTWEQLDDVQLPVGVFFLCHAAVAAAGAVHWHLSDGMIFGFRFEGCSWTTTFSAPNMDDEYESKTLAEYEGKLALMCMRNSGMDLWVLEQYENRVWKKRLSLSSGDLECEEEKWVWPLCFESSDIAVMWGNHSQRLIYSKFGHGSCSMSGAQLGHHKPWEIFPFWSDYEGCSFVHRFDLVNVNTRQRKIKQAEEHGSYCGE